jgi:hypothetical protein
MLFEIVKGTFNPSSFVEQEELPPLHELFVLFRMWWRQDVGLVLTPHLSSHDRSIVGAVTDGNASGVIDQVRYLLSVVFVGGCEVDSGQLSRWIDCSVQFEAIVPALPVLTEGGNAFGYPMPVSPHQPTDMEHRAVHESERSIFHK